MYINMRPPPAWMWRTKAPSRPLSPACSRARQCWSLPIGCAPWPEPTTSCAGGRPCGPAGHPGGADGAGRPLPPHGGSSRARAPGGGWVHDFIHSSLLSSFIFREYNILCRQYTAVLAEDVILPFFLLRFQHSDCRGTIRLASGAQWTH